MRRTTNMSVVPPSKAPVVSFSKRHYPHCLVLIGYRNGFARELTIELNYTEGPIVKYLQTQSRYIRWPVKELYGLSL